MNKRFMKMVIIVLALAMAGLGLAGCDSAIQPVNQAYVVSLGIDKGEENDYKITFLIPYLTADASAGQDSTYAIGIECESLVDAINAVNVNNPNNITLTHVNFVIFGEDFVVEEGLSGLVISMCRNVEMNWTANVVACKGSAEDYIKGIQAEKGIDVDSLQDNILDTSERSSFYPNMMLIDAYDSILNGDGLACALASGNKEATEQLEDKQEGGGGSASDEQSYVGMEDLSAFAGEDKQEQPMGSESPGGQPESTDAGQQPEDPDSKGSEQQGEGASKQDEKLERLNLLQTPGEFKRTGGLGSDISGAAIIKDGKMVGDITGHDARCLLMIRDEFRESNIVIANPFADDGIMGVRVKRAKGPRIKVSAGDRPEIDVHIFLMVTSFTHNKPEDYTQPGMREQLAQHVNASIKGEMDAMLEKVRQYECDIFSFGDYAAKNFWTKEAYEAYDWPEKYKRAEIDVTIETWFIHPDFDKMKVVSD